MKKISISILILTAAFLSIFLVYNCGSDPTSSSDTTIGPKGGTVTDAGGASVYIPAGALSAETDIYVSTIANEDALPDSIYSYLLSCNGGGVFEPHGLTFDDSVTITLPLETALTPGDTMCIFTWSESDTSWQQTQFDGIVSSDGFFVSAKVTHFSSYIVDFNLADGFLPDFDFEKRPDMTFFEFRKTFQKDVYEPGMRKIPKRSGCCFKITKNEYKMEYVNGGPPVTASTDYGPGGSYSRIERFSFLKGSMDSNQYCKLTTNVYMEYEDPRLLIHGYNAVINIDEGENSVPLTGEFKCSNHFYDGNGTIEFTVDGPGSVTPSKIPSIDDWETVFTSYETGTAIITATFISCEEEPSQRPSYTFEVKCVENKGWFIAIRMNFIHSGEGIDWTFIDQISMIAYIYVDSTGVVTGDNIEGSHWGTSVAPDHCSLTGISAPDFSGGQLEGTQIGENIQFRYAPDPATFMVAFSLHCEREDPEPDYDITIAAYTYLEASILSQILFELPFKVGGYNGSGEFGEADPPVKYSYEVYLGMRYE